jgi:protein-L-isoaspartate(D-aspartate) O-methyltransferase
MTEDGIIPTPLAAARRSMVERQLRPRGIHDPAVLAAMLEIPRELFIPEASRAQSYADAPVPIGHGQTISQPYITALMTQCLELKGTEMVLEVGCGSGYHAAVLGALSARVVSTEIIPALAEQARANLAAADRAGNVTVLEADGSEGCPEFAPFDAISVAAAAPLIPQHLLEQLKDPGRLVIPVGDLEDQDLMVVTKSGGQIHSRTAGAVRFVPLRGGQGWR